MQRAEQSILVVALGAGLLVGCAEDRFKALSAHHDELSAKRAAEAAAEQAKNDPQLRAAEQVAEKKAAVWADYTAKEGGFVRMGVPRPGDWLDAFLEPGQTLSEYRRAGPNRPRKQRDVVYLQPLGGLARRNPALLDAARDHARAFFLQEVRILPPRPLPEEAWVEAREQYDGNALLRWLSKRRPDDALMVLGLLEEDLFAINLGFVFGVATFYERVGVYSIARYGDRSSLEARRRTLKVLSHEAGHMLGIAHCVFYHCAMSGSNSLQETDRHPIHLCPLDEEKLAWNLRVDRLERRRGLARTYRELGLVKEAKEVEARGQREKPAE